MPAGPDGYRRDPASQSSIQSAVRNDHKVPGSVGSSSSGPPSTQVVASVIGTDFTVNPLGTSLPDPRFDKLNCGSPISLSLINFPGGRAHVVPLPYTGTRIP
jgi:hypothetical protein